MNTLELAVYLEDITDSEESPYRQAATMLRWQHSKLFEQHERLHKYQLRHAEQRKRIAELEGQLVVILEANTRSRP